jgi:hypothetical protein
MYGNLGIFKVFVRKSKGVCGYNKNARDVGYSLNVEDGGIWK